MARVDEAGMADAVDIRATFCHEMCDRGPTVIVGNTTLHRSTAESAFAEVQATLNGTASESPSEPVHG
jgi:NADH:ubiquinone oxidoreductase subunit E